MERCPECGEPITYRAVAVLCVCKQDDDDLDDVDELVDDEGPE